MKFSVELFKKKPQQVSVKIRHLHVKNSKELLEMANKVEKIDQSLLSWIAMPALWTIVYLILITLMVVNLHRGNLGSGIMWGFFMISWMQMATLVRICD